MRASYKSVLAIAVVAAGLSLAVAWVGLRTAPGHESGVPNPATLDYLARLDVRRFERQGTDYTNPHFSPLRLGKPFGQIDIVHDYDFARLEAVTRSLDGVDRRTVLAAIFERVTRGCRTETERHLAALKFLHKAGNHAPIQPMRPDRQDVLDPLVLLELGEMRCGHVNRVAVDLFRAAGYDGRVVQAAYHVSAEVFYDGSWHMCDGDIWGNGECVVSPSGAVPSVAELSQDPGRLDGLTAYWEPDWRNAPNLGGRACHPSWYFFAEEAYRQSGVRPVVYVKTATPRQEQRSIHYGWEHFRTDPDPDRKLWPELPRHPIPKCPVIERCELSVPHPGGPAVVDLEWRADPAAAGYQVFVARRSRGWNFNSDEALAPGLRSLKSSTRGWRPEDYEARFAEPPSDVTRLDVPGPRAQVKVPPGGPYFVTVMAYDAHARAAGRRVFPMSEELKLTP